LIDLAERRDPPQPPDADDWFAEPSTAAPARSPQARTTRPREPEPRDDLGDDPAEAPGGLVIAGRTIGPRELLAAAVVVILLIVAGLAAAGVFSNGKHHANGPKTTASTPTTTSTHVTTTAPSQPSGPPPLPVPTTKLKAGSQGAQVKQLQRALAHLGHAPGAVDGIFGPLTEAAVMRFQTASKLVADGVVGPLTLAALGKALRNGG
jgi:Putative peptidoglycan binding domain